MPHGVDRDRHGQAAANAARPDGAALLGKACDVLEAVAATPGGISHPELAAKLGLPRATLYRILATLVARGLLHQDPERRVYGVGLRVLEMAHGARSSPDLPAAAAPELRALRDATGETAYVAVLDGREAVTLGKLEGAHPVRSAAQPGQRKPLHATSQGKVMLAFLPDEEREALLQRLPMRRLTPQTVTDRRRLAATLRIARARGFAIDDEEVLRGVRCVGAPVLDASGRVLGAVSVAGPAWRLTLERLDLLGPEVAAAGRRIGAQLRHPPSPAPAGPERALPGPAAYRGLAPRWSAGAGRLWWADALSPEIRCLEADGTERAVARWEAPVRALALAGGGDALVVDGAGTAARLGPDGAVRARRQGAALAGLLALRVRPDGEAWASVSAPDDGVSLIGPLLADGTLRPTWRLPGAVSALAWAPDGTALFAAAPESGTVHRLEPGRPAPLVLARLPAGSGRPSGLAVDAGGQLWAAMRDGWSVAQLDHSGEVERILPLPVPRPTDLCFGGPDLDTLYVTTARDGVGLDVLASAPLSGRVLAVVPGVTGAAEAETDWI